MQTPDLLEHLADTRARFGPGTDSPHDTAWTSAEQNAFFRALVIYSRWRPDLIAAALPTKTAWQVEQYLVALEEGAAGDDTDEGDSDLEIEPAYEVSEAWVAAEEALALHVIEEENLALLERHGGTVDDEDGTEEKKKRPRGRPRVHHSGRRRRGARRLSPDTDEDAHTPKPSSDPVEEEPLRTKRPRVTVSCQDYMTYLDEAHLTVLDSLLREGEELRTAGSSVPPETTDVDDPSNALIDPVLLAVSQGILLPCTRRVAAD